MAAIGRFKRFIYQGMIPVTKVIIVLAGIVFLLYYLLQLFNYKELYGLLMLTPESIFHSPWTLMTYPLVNPDPLYLIFALVWLWFIGGYLERIWGSWTYGLFIFLVTLVTGIVMAMAGRFVSGGFVVITGIWLPLVAMTWAWAGIFPDREILLWGIIPLRAEWLAWINALIVFFQYALSYHWVMGVASLSGILVVYLFRRKGSGGGLRYWSWNHGFSLQGWLEKRRRKARKSKFKVIKH